MPVATSSIYPIGTQPSGAQLLPLHPAARLLARETLGGCISRATLALSGTDLPDVQDDGNYWRFGKVEPTQVKIEIPATDILGAPWVLTDGSNVTDELVSRIQGDNETVTLTNQFRVNATNVDYYVSLVEPGGGQLNTATIRLPASAAGTSDDLDLIRLIKDRAWCEVGDYTIDVTTNATRSLVGTSLTFVFNYEVVDGTKPTGNALRQVSVYGEDIHRGEVARQAFRLETPSIAGKGGTDSQIWTRGSSNEDAQWQDAPQKDPDSAATTKFYRREVPSTASGLSPRWSEDSNPEYYQFFADDAAVGGTADAITVSVSPAATAYRDGMQVVFEPTADNTASATINVDSLGAKTIVREDGSTLQAGDIKNDRFAHVVYDGVFFVLLNRYVAPVSGMRFVKTLTGVTDNALTFLTNAELATIGANDLIHGQIFEINDNWKTYPFSFRKGRVTSGWRWFVAADDSGGYTNGSRYQWRLNGTGGSQVMQVQEQGSGPATATIDIFVTPAT